ncbi:MAG TPA: NAD(P)/FAD-dependent oxidoreductase [Bryobacteraceae bacterium]|nr:NAD(P)/FAD-dependent oxidoreductase [Bryobacteraceae bacterium]
MLESVDVLIVGAGFSGLCMAIQLRKAGIESFLVIEKGEEIGGTWWYNRYPGCACDVPSHLYSFSFDRNPDWSRRYAEQPEILDYLRESAKCHGVADRIRLRTPLHEAAWDEQQGVWHAMAGDDLRIDARVLVSGMGALHVPRFPEIRGLERFAGPAFHSAEWDSSVNLESKNVAVIGTGASAVQFVPRIATQAGKLSVFQRTPAWILPRADGPIPENWRRIFRRVPGATWLLRTMLFWSLEMYVFSFLGNRKLRALGEKQARRHLAKQVSDPELRARLTPDYEFGCKRIVISSEFYPALMRPNVELVTTGISEVRAQSVVTADGTERPIDVIVYGTGFRVTDMLRGIRLTGRGGIEIHEAWRERISAYLGITVNGFPNLFFLLGPNTGLGHNSVILMIEAQVRYVMSCLRMMEKRGQRVMEVRPDSQRQFVEELRGRLPGTVWESGCKSWYQDERTGESTAIWPASVVAYQRRTRGASAEDYVFE